MAMMPRVIGRIVRQRSRTSPLDVVSSVGICVRTLDAPSAARMCCRLVRSQRSNSLGIGETNACTPLISASMINWAKPEKSILTVGIDVAVSGFVRCARRLTQFVTQKPATRLTVLHKQHTDVTVAVATAQAHEHVLRVVERA